MKKIIVFATILISAQLTFAQTAMDFQGPDCNGNQVHLFSDLDAGKAVMIIFYMPNCGACPPVAQKLQTMANKINASHPGKVKAYAFPYDNPTTCSYSSGWVSSNNLPLFTPMDSGAYQVAYYGGFGMPTAVLLGGTDHRVMIENANFVASDTTIFRDSILNFLGVSQSGIKELSSSIQGLNVYPNPATNVVNVDFTAAKNSNLLLELINIEGKQMIAPIEEKSVSGKITKQMNVSTIPSGVYTVRIHLGEAIETHRITILH